MKKIIATVIIVLAVMLHHREYMQTVRNRTMNIMTGS